MSFRIGAGYDGTHLPIPITLSYLAGRSMAGALELGAGATFLRTGQTNETLGTAMIGYRYAPAGAHFMFRLTVSVLVKRRSSPLRHADDEWGWVLPGLAVGWPF